MARNINHITVSGYLGKDAGVATYSGGSMAYFSLGSSYGIKNKSTGAWDNKTSWFNVVVFDDHYVKTTESNGKKGASVMVQGRAELKVRDKQDGTKDYSVQITVGGPGSCVFWGHRDIKEDVAIRGNAEPISNGDDDIPF